MFFFILSFDSWRIFVHSGHRYYAIIFVTNHYYHSNVCVWWFFWMRNFFNGDQFRGFFSFASTIERESWWQLNEFVLSKEKTMIFFMKNNRQFVHCHILSHKLSKLCFFHAEFHQHSIRCTVELLRDTLKKIYYHRLSGRIVPCNKIKAKYLCWLFVFCWFGVNQTHDEFINPKTMGTKKNSYFFLSLFSYSYQIAELKWIRFNQIEKKQLFCVKK